MAARRFDGVRFRQLREDRKISREAIALTIDRSFTTVAAYEGGRIAPSLTAAAALASALGVQIDELMANDGRAVE
jgi:DNA-binding XRE family transcriptional regulator